MTRQQREQLQHLRKRSADKRADRSHARTVLNAAREDGDQDAIGTAELALQAAEREVELAEELQQHLLGSLNGSGSGLGVMMREDPQSRAMLAEIAQSSAPLQNYQKVGNFMTAEELVAMHNRSFQAAGVTLPAEPIDGTGLGVMPTPQAPLRLGNLFPAVNQETRFVSWLQRTGTVVAAVAPHGTVKAQATLVYTDKSEEAATVAVWVKMNRQDLEDYDGVEADLRQALDYGVRDKTEELQVADILGSTGIVVPDFTPWGADVSNAIDRIIVAVAEQRLTGAQPNFAAMNPLDAAAVAIDKGGDGHYVGAAAAFGAGGPLAGVTPVQSAALTRGQALVGDSAIGAKLGIRSGVTVWVGMESDDALRNRVTLLCESRVTPMTTVPSVFSKIALA